MPASRMTHRSFVPTASILKFRLVIPPDSAVNGQKLDGLPAWPLFETLVGLLLVVGSIYYLIAVRGRAVEIEADAVTGEGIIG